MFETMSIYSLVLMLSAALLFPPAFRQLTARARASRPETAWNLGAATLPFAAVCWYVTALWAQASRPLGASLAVFVGLLVVFTLAFAALPLRPRPGLRRLSRTLVVLLAYAAMCWTSIAFFAAASGASFDVQALMFGYLLLCPALTVALLPRPQPVASALFVVLTALLLYAFGTGATSAFWGAIPAPPAWMQPAILVLVALLMLGVLAWMLWQARNTQVVRLARAAVIVVGRGIVKRAGTIGEAGLTVVAVARALFNTLWRGIKSIPVLFWKMTVGIGNGLVNAIVWLVSVPVWLVTALPPFRHGLAILIGAIGRGMAGVLRAGAGALIAIPRGIIGGLMADGRALIKLVTMTPGALWRAATWLVTDLIPGIGRGFLALLQAMTKGFGDMARGTGQGFVALTHALVRAPFAAWRGLSVLTTAVARGSRCAAVWTLTAFVPGTGRELLALVAAIVSLTIRLVIGVGQGLVAAARAFWNACVWVPTVMVPTTARAFWHGLLALVRGLGKVLATAAHGVWRAGVWLVTDLVPGIGRGLPAMLREFRRGIAAGARTMVHAILVIVVAPIRLTVWLATVALPFLSHTGTVVLRATAQMLRALALVLVWSVTAIVVVGVALFAWSYVARVLWPPAPPSLHVAAASNFKPLEPILLRWGSENGVAVQITYKGSLDIAASLDDGGIAYDAVWQGDSLWATAADKPGLVKHSTSIMCSPVVLGVKQSIATRLGWVGNPQVRLDEVLAAAESASLRMFMASPSKSNSGALAYLNFLDSFAGDPNRMTRLMRTMDRTGDSSGWLRDSCRDQYGRCDAMINYESLILEMNREVVARGQEPMYIVYPTEGLGLADFPLSFVNKASAGKESLFLRFQGYLQSEAVQNEIAALGNRIGARCERVDHTIFNPAWGADLTRNTETAPHPAKPAIDQAMDLYQRTFRKPSFTVYLLDYSTSMQGSRGSYLQMAMRVVLDQKEAARYLLQGTSDDATVVIPFAGRILTDEDVRSWTVAGSDSEEVNRLLKKIQSQSTADMTNIYTPVARALYLMKQEDIGNYMPAIILLTDGESNRGSLEEVRRALEETGLYNVPVFGITFGDASQQQLNELAALTGGRVFDGTKDLIEAFRLAKGQN